MHEANLWVSPKFNSAELYLQSKSPAAFMADRALGWRRKRVYPTRFPPFAMTRTGIGQAPSPTLLKRRQ
jgi:hypothetical protein